MNRIIGCLLLLLACSCTENTLYHSYQPVDSTGWHKNDTLTYTLKAALKAQESYNYLIGIRHKDSYPYKDIWLTVNQDTLHLYLADSVGRWKGTGIGELRQFQAPFTITAQPEDSTFRITHIMQENPLYGIHDIGLSIQQCP